jgi:hypothetical protein
MNLETNLEMNLETNMAMNMAAKRGGRKAFIGAAGYSGKHHSQMGDHGLLNRDTTAPRARVRRAAAARRSPWAGR